MAQSLVKVNREVSTVVSDPKADNFKRLAVQRTEAILEGLRKLGNLSNKNNYVFTEEEVDKIYRTIAQEMVMTRRKFHPGFKRFSFDDV